VGTGVGVGVTAPVVLYVTVKLDTFPEYVSVEPVGNHVAANRSTPRLKPPPGTGFQANGIRLPIVDGPVVPLIVA